MKVQKAVTDHAEGQEKEKEMTVKEKEVAVKENEMTVKETEVTEREKKAEVNRANVAAARTDHVAEQGKQKEKKVTTKT